MMRGDTPCSAVSYVRNGGALFEGCLRSGLFCREHVVLDGGSTDGSLDLARRYGCRILPQDPRFLDRDGRIIHFGGIANQAYAAAEQKWVLLLGADEALSEELEQSIRAVIASGRKGAYFVHRYFVFHGRVMRHASTNPNSQIRFCHRDSMLGFKHKPVHERPILAPGVTEQLLPGGVQLLPIVDTPGQWKTKYRRYLDLERAQLSSFGWRRWIPYAVQRLCIMLVLFGRMIGYRIFFRHRDCLPLRYDMLNLWYSWQLILRSCPVCHSSGQAASLTVS